MADKFGNYELVRRIAQGGMAEVHLARFSGVEGFERPVVIKRMLPELAVRKDFVDMFLDEARLAARFNHPNIVQVYELGEKDGSYFMAMEYVDGPHLGILFAHSLRQKKPLPIPMCCYIVARAAEGLHHAHDLKDASGQPLNIVHRDVSPQNILVSKEGDVKVMDFGVAKATTQVTQTRTGVIKGKIGYMSPEQCLANAVDRRTDVFALGIVLYELVTRRRLFRDKSDLVVMQKITMEDVPPPSSVNPRIPKELDDVIMRAMRRDVNTRTTSALQLSDELDAYLAGSSEPATRAQLTRWMRENAPDLGPGAGDSNTAHPTPSWSPSSPSNGSQSQPRNPGTPAAGAPLPALEPTALARPEPASAGLDHSGPDLPPVEEKDANSLEADRTPVDEGASPSGSTSTPPARSRAPLYAAAAAVFLLVGGGTWAVLSKPGGSTGPATGSSSSGGGAATDVQPATSAASGPATPASGPAPATSTAAPPPTSTPATTPTPRKEGGALRILAEPPNASITVNRVARGTCEKGPLLVDGLPMDPAEAAVVVELDGYDTQRMVVPLAAGETITLPVVRLRKTPAQVRPSRGTFDITTEPSNLKVSIDGRAVGRTPLMKLELPEGQHSLQIDAPSGYADVRTSIKSVAGVKQSLPYTLEKKDRPSPGPDPRPAPDNSNRTGRLTIDTSPYWTYVYVGSKSLGPTPVPNAEVPAGKITLRLRRDGKDGCTIDVARTVDVAPGAQTKKTFTIEARDAKGDCL